MPQNLLTRTRAAVLLILGAGFALSLVVFYPGVMTYDARALYDDALKGQLGDWQSPVMGVWWRALDRIVPGAAGMFLEIDVLYWLAFAILACWIAGRSRSLAFALALLALTPPAFVFVGIIWRDVLFAHLWLLAAAFAAVAPRRRGAVRMLLRAAALGLVVLGYFLRENALFAVPILAAFVLWPLRFRAAAGALLALPALAALLLFHPVVYYELLGAERQHPIQSIMVFDLGGITHFAGENQFPLAWPPEQEAILETGCYRPTEWDIYWWQEPCRFVMQRLEAEKVFGSPALEQAWVRAVTHHPLAYLHHRLAYFWNFLAGGGNLAMFTEDIRDPPNTVYADRPAFLALKSLHDALKPTPLFRPGTWLLLDLGLVLLAWRRRGTPGGAFVLGVCGSAVVYVMTYLGAGVSSDFRYGYWAVLAALAGLATFGAIENPRGAAKLVPDADGSPPRHEIC